MAKVLILFAHPALEKSRTQTCLLNHARHVSGITIHDLYQHYPDFEIDVDREQKLLLQHDIIIFQHPFYWYSAPAIVKQWQDLVLEHGWAYGREGKALVGKIMFNAISAGGRQEAYQPDGYNQYSIHEFLRPFEQTARLCNMHYWPPFMVHGTHRMEPADIELHAIQYEELLTALLYDRLNYQQAARVRYLNDLLPIPTSIQS